MSVNPCRRVLAVPRGLCHRPGMPEDSMTSTPDSARTPWHGVLVATALPFREPGLAVDLDAYGDHVAWLVEHGCDGVDAQRVAGRVPDPDGRGAGRRGGHGRGRGAGGQHRDARGRGVRRPRGLPLDRAGGRGRRPGRHAAAAQRLPGRRGRRSSSTTPRWPRSGCRSSPTTTRSTPRSTSRPRCWRGCTGTGSSSRSRSSPATCAGRTRSPSWRQASTSSSGPTTSRSRWSWPAPSAGSSGYPNAFPEACVALWRACLAHDLETALPLYRELHPLLRWDSKTEFVQAIKLSMDMVGRHGGACRPPRGPLTPEQDAAVRAATERAIAAGFR